MRTTFASYDSFEAGLRIPLRWLADYVDLTIDPEDLARRLTVAGAEVGEIIATRDWNGIVVAHVEKIEKHPNADRLVLATVDIGSNEHPQVVCGAPNVREGQKVAYAGIGTRLIDGYSGEEQTLKAAKIRGVESNGMICSEKELGLSDEHAGILVLSEDALVGTPLAEVIGDTIFDIEVTANRPDWLSVLGIAREVAALTGQKWRDPELEYPEGAEPASKFVRVEIQDPDLCTRYVGSIVEDVKIGDSPQWMQERLLAAGMRPINNVVDITNYVMLEMGQPLHAFDNDKVRGNKIIVRRAKEGEQLTLIDGSEHDLKGDMLLICDADGPVAVAGVMGGGESEVSAQTTTVLLEAANFKGTSVRRTSQALKLRTDASTRFEKGLPRDLPAVASARAVKLMVELCGGRAAKGTVDAFPGKAVDVTVNVTMERLTRVLGVEVPADEVRRILTSLGFGVDWVPPDHFAVNVPYWRTDVSIADDVIEEVARIMGYDELPTTQLRGQIPTYVPQPLQELRERVRTSMADAGMQEIITYSMTDMESLAKVLPPEELAIHRPLHVANPISRQHEYARTTLRHSLLQTLAANLRGSHDVIELFEAGRIYIPRDADLPHEVETVAGVLSGRLPDRWGRPTGDPAGFFDAKARLEFLLADLHVEAEFREANDFAYLAGRTAEVFVEDDRIGLVGEIHPRVAADFGIDREVAMFELDLEALLPHVQPIVHHRPVSPYPPVVEDIAIVVDADVSAGRGLEIIRASPLVTDAGVIDVYTGDQIPAGKKSLAFSITYQARDRTLSDADVAKQRDRIVERLRRELNAELRQ
jgi:phenylalanyl-tRNA synthetase beta chain